jgi:hypothetical protein
MRPDPMSSMSNSNELPSAGITHADKRLGLGLPWPGGPINQYQIKYQRPQISPDHRFCNSP